MSCPVTSHMTSCDPVYTQMAKCIVVLPPGLPVIYLVHITKMEIHIWNIYVYLWTAYTIVYMLFKILERYYAYVYNIDRYYPWNN